MTYQPPPPPPGGGSPAKFDPKAVNPLDFGIIGAGVLAFIFSLFPYYTVSVDAQTVGSIRIAGGSESATAWSGFFGWTSTLLALAGAVVVALALFAPQITLPRPNRQIGLGLFAVATLFVILAFFLNGYDDQGSDLVDTGRGFGYYASLLVILIGTALSLMRFQATGGQLPGNLQNKVPNVGGYGPQGGIGGAQGGPGAQGGYGTQGGPGAQGGYGNPGNPGTPPPPPPAGNEPPPPPPGYGPPR